MTTSQPEFNKRFPIGHYKFPDNYSLIHLNAFIKQIAEFPLEVEALTSNLSEEELNLTYRENSWTIRQVVHHCADSHMNSFIRFKLALTENNPTIKPYFEDRWAELKDSSLYPITDSIMILKGLHAKWNYLLSNLELKDFDKTFFHPESNKSFSLHYMTGFYAWHGLHHIGHIKLALNNS